jgi:hypothetical protein
MTAECACVTTVSMSEGMARDAAEGAKWGG